MLSAETVVDYLVTRGVLSSDAEASVSPLGGGVSNVVLAVSAPGVRLVVKQALPRLRVADTWLAKRERTLSEAAALRFVREVTPEAVPSVVDCDGEACAVTIEWAPEDWTPWKDSLLREDADPKIATQLGLYLGRWHAHTAQEGVLDKTFDDAEAFWQLRVDPYYLTAAARNPAVSSRLTHYAELMTSTRRCLVHGDFSPKNVLTGDGVWVIDFEVAHRGDPAFDVAFLLNHLALKAVHLPQSTEAFSACAEAFWDAYSGALGPQLRVEPAYVFGHVGCLMLARVDGKSPAEYLDEAGRGRARRLAHEVLADPPRGPAALFGMLKEACR